MTKTKATYIYTVTLPNTPSHNIELTSHDQLKSLGTEIQKHARFSYAIITII